MAMEFPSDLVEEILSWVPAKSLTLLKYTCKQWKTLISDPRFVNKHLSHMRCREQQFTVFNNVSAIDSCSKVSCMRIDFNKHKNPCLDLHVLKDVSSMCKLVQNMYHCDGLLLLVTRINLLLLNPLLKQARWIKGGSSFDNTMDAYGLGYISNQASSTCNDYRMVSFRCAPLTQASTRVEVYEFKSDSWKSVVDRTFDGFFGLPLSSACLRGTPYWIGYNKYDNKTFSIQSFDFSKERFEPLFLPPSSFEREDLISLGIFRGDHLSLLHKSCFADQIHIWVMMKQHWNTLMTVAIPELSMSYKYPTYFIENNGKLVLSVHHFETGSIRTYIVGENQECKKLKRYYCMDCKIGGRYVPSLLQVPGCSVRRRKRKEHDGFSIKEFTVSLL